MQPFLALITPVDSPNPPSQPPLGIWGGRPPNWIDNTLPGLQPGGPVRPWGPINYPDQGLPGQQPRPWGPVFYPDQGLPPLQPLFPPVIWDPSRPTNPIVNPGDPNNPGAGQPQPPQAQGIEWKVAWSPVTGWIVVGIPTGPTPTPSQGDETADDSAQG